MNYSKKDLERKKKNEIIQIAKTLKIKGRSLLRKDQLIREILKTDTTKSPSISNESRKKAVTIIKKTDIIKTKKERLDQKKKSLPKLDKKNVQISIQKPIEERQPLLLNQTEQIEKPLITPVKIHVHQTVESKTIVPHELPQQYNIDKLVLLPRDPYWAYAYWEISKKTIDRIKKYDPVNLFLCIVEIQGDHEFTAFEIQVGTAPNWYLDLKKSNTWFKVKLIYKTADCPIELNTSEAIHTPPDYVSPRIEETYINPYTPPIITEPEPPVLPQVEPIIEEKPIEQPEAFVEAVKECLEVIQENQVAASESNIQETLAITQPKPESYYEIVFQVSGGNWVFAQNSSEILITKSHLFHVSSLFHSSSIFSK